MTTNYRAFTKQLRAAGWHSYGQGHYRPPSGHTFSCFDGVVFDGKAQELWRWYAERGITPDPDKSQAERQRMVQDESHN